MWQIGELLGRAGFEPAQTYCQRIYSPSPLTARASTQEESLLGLLVIRDQLPFVVPYPQGKSNPRCLLEREMSWTTRRWGPICLTTIYYDHSMNSFLKLSIEWYDQIRGIFPLFLIAENFLIRHSIIHQNGHSPLYIEIQYRNLLV